MKRFLCGLAVGLCLGMVGQAKADLIGNGGFETPVTPSGQYVTLYAGGTSMAPWAITRGSVDVVNNGYWPAYQGLNSLDLDGFTPGAISQSFPTTPGASYVLSFAYADNADHSPIGPRHADVTVAGASTLLTASITHYDSSRADMNYVLFSEVFTADSTSATLEFASTDSGVGSDQGIVLDAVAVEPAAAPVPEPSTLPLLGMSALGLIGWTWRRYRFSSIGWYRLRRELMCSHYTVRCCRQLLAGILLCLSVTIANNRIQADPVLDPVLWLRADAGVTTDGSGGVAAWADQSRAGHDASQAAPSSRAQLVPGVLNGNPVLHFNGSTSFFNVTGQVLTSQRFTIFTVVNDLGLSDYTFREVFSNWNPISNEATSVFFGLAHENPARARLTDNFGGADPPYFQQGVGEITNPATHFIFTGVSGLTDALIYQNTDLIAEKGGSLTTRNLEAPYHIGQQGPEGLLEHWNGDIAEILVYNRELAADERQQVWNYLGEKYFAAAPVPEPSTLLLLGMGAFGVIGWIGRRQQRVNPNKGT